MRSLVGPVHDVLVGPLEIESIDQRFAHAPVLELVTPRVDEPALRAGGRVVGQHGSLDAPILECRKIVARRPGTRGELLAEQIVFCGEAFETNLPVAIIFEANDVEIALSARYGEIGAPPILDALKLDEMSDLEAPDFIGAAAKRSIKRRLVEWFFRIIGTRKDRKRGDEKGHVAPTLFGKSHDHCTIVSRLRAREIAQLLRDDRMAFFFQRRKRP